MNLAHGHFQSLEGVYIIWRSTDGRVVRVGQGLIADRLRTHRSDPDILAYQGTGSLLVTWATVATAYRDGVERFLAGHYTPLVGSASPFTAPIPVNLPEAA